MTAKIGPLRKRASHPAPEIVTQQRRFLSKVGRQRNGCWHWQGALLPSGYGVWSRRGSNILAHRASYELFRSSIPKGRIVCHRCDVRSCVNPSHLFLGTARSNAQDKVAKGRHRHGARHPGARLSSDQVRQIRQRYAARSVSKVTQRALAQEYGVSQTSVRRLLVGKTWRSAGGPILQSTDRTRQVRLGANVAQQIRREYKQLGVTQAALGRKYGVGQACVSHIVTGRVYPTEQTHKNLSDHERCQRRFRSKLKINRRGCWIWQAGKFADGYGAFGMRGKTWRAHRASYVLFKGPIPNGMHVCHTCDTRACVNPVHLRLGTNADNQRDVVQRGRRNSPRGSRHYRTRLTEQDVREIRHANERGTSQVALARQYGISFQAVNHIVLRKRWKHVR